MKESDSAFKPQAIGNRNCDQPLNWDKYPSYDYIARTTTGDDDYPDDACRPFIQANVKFDNIEVLGPSKNIYSAWLDTELATAKALPAKPFDIPHPTKQNYRLRHVSLEGPEIGVYFRGSLKDNNIINLPDYWDGLIDLETITVNLTSVGFYQELFVEKIECGKRIIIKNREGGPVNCYYTVYAERKDLQKLIVEYEGTTIQDYPGEDFISVKKYEDFNA